MEFMEERVGPTPNHIIQSLPTIKVTLAQLGTSTFYLNFIIDLRQNLCIRCVGVQLAVVGQGGVFLFYP